MGLNIGNESVRASAVLIVSGLISTLILFFNVLAIARLLGPTLYGEYTLALLPASIFIIFSGVGVNTAITRYSALHLSKNETELARRKTANGLAFLLILAVALSLSCFLTSSLISSYIFHRPELTVLVRLASLSVFGQVIFQTSISAMVGWNTIRQAGFSYIVQSVLRIVLTLGLILVGLGVWGAVAGQISGQVLAALSAITIIYLMKLRSGSFPKGIEVGQFLRDVSEEIRFGAPSEVGGYISNFAGFYYALIVLAFFVSNQVIGYFQAATNVTVLISIISTSISMSLFAGFTRLHGAEGDTRSGFSFAVRYVAYFGAPLVFFLAVASKPIILLVYGSSFLPATTLLALVSLSNIPMIIGQSVFPPYFNAIGKTKFTMYAFLGDALVAMLLAPPLAFYFGAIGVILALFGSNLVSGVLALGLAKKYLNAGINYKTSLSALVASVICYGATFEILNLNVGALGQVFLQALVFFGLYLVLAPLLRVVASEDVNLLKASLSGLGPLGSPVIAILRIESALTKRLGRK